jgi:hypothetical protein
MLDSLLFQRHLDDGEVLSRVVHKHPILGLRELFWPSIFLLFSLVLLLTWPKGVALWIVMGLIGACGMWWLRQFFNYYLDAWIITDQGIIDLNWVGWFHRQSARVLYSDIQGVSYEINGVLATLLKYGDISVEKISTGTAISLPYVHKPKIVESLILKNMEEYLHKKNIKNSKHVQEILSAFVAEQAQLKDAESKNQKHA